MSDERGYISLTHFEFPGQIVEFRINPHAVKGRPTIVIVLGRKRAHVVALPTDGDR
jgi:hypothetical protein